MTENEKMIHLLEEIRKLLELIAKSQEQLLKLLGKYDNDYLKEVEGENILEG